MVTVPFLRRKCVWSKMCNATTTKHTHTCKTRQERVEFLGDRMMRWEGRTQHNFRIQNRSTARSSSVVNKTIQWVSDSRSNFKHFINVTQWQVNPRLMTLWVTLLWHLLCFHWLCMELLMLTSLDNTSLGSWVRVEICILTKSNITIEVEEYY